MNGIHDQSRICVRWGRLSGLVPVIFVLLAAWSPPSKASEALLLVLSKFKECQIEEAFNPNSNGESKKRADDYPLEKYLSKRLPAEQRSGVARFRVFDTVLGLNVIWIDMPIYASRNDNQIWRIFFVEDYETVRRVVSNAIGVAFPQSPQTTDRYIRGEAPALLIDKSGVVYLICRNTEMGD